MRRNRRHANGWIGIVLPLVLITLWAGSVGGQTCAEGGCWELHEPIYIYGNAGFTCENGVRSGSGSFYDPYVIEGWRIVASGASYGIQVRHTTRYFVIRNCVLETASGAGIHFYGVENGTVEGCHLLRNERGILFENSRGNGITGNLIADNHYGVDLLSGTRDTAISKNTFLGNGRNGHDPEGRNLWYCGLVGNYWSDYVGEDRDCDGIGDVPHRAPIDRYPLMASPWQCALPVQDVCAAHCGDSTQVLRELGAATEPCGPSTACAPASSCQPRLDTCADQVLSCQHPVATLTAEFCPSRPSCAPCSIQWIRDGGQVVGTGPTLQVRDPGVYTAVAAGADGCSVSKSVTVTADRETPSVQVTADRMLSCSTDEVVLSAVVAGGCAPYAYEWRRSGTAVLGAEALLRTTQPGTYTVTVTGANGCAASDTLTVTQDLQAPSVTTVVSGELTCGVSQVKLTALASNGRLPYAYEWRGPAGAAVGTSAEIYVSQPGTYTVRVSGANGCSATGSAIVTDDSMPPTVAVVGGGTLTCAVSEVTLTANVSRGRPPYGIEWIGPSGNVVGTAPVVVVSTPGLYTVSVVGANGCRTTASATVLQDVSAPEVHAGPDAMLSEEVKQVVLSATIESPGPYTVRWQNESGDVLSTSASVTLDRPGEYTVTVVRDTGCSASDQVVVNSTVITEVLLESGIPGLAVFGQLTLDGVPIPESVFYFHVGTTLEAASGVDVSSVGLRTGTGAGFRANGVEVNYIIPGNSIVSFQIHKDQFIAGKWYQLLHLPTDPPGAAAVKFF